MIRSKSNPTDETIYGDYKWLISILYVCSLGGSIYSGMTEWNGFKSDELAKTFPILYPAIGLLLIESMRVIAPALFLTVSRLLKKFEWKRIPILLILAGLVFGLTFLSIVKSEDGINYKADKAYEFTKDYQVDSSQYKLLTATCNSSYYSDSLSAATKAKSEFGSDLKEHQKAKKAANTRISEIKHIKDTWAVRTVSKMTNIAQTAIGNIDELKVSMQSAIQDSLNIAKSEYKYCLANANDTLLYYSNKARTEYEQEKKDNEGDKNQKVERNYFLMCLGVLFILLHAIGEQWLFHVSGVEVAYKFNATDKGIGFNQKAMAILKVHSQNLGNWFLGILSLGYELSVSNDELVINERKKTTKSGTKWWQLIKKKQYRKRLERELKATKEQQEYEMKKAALEAEKARLEQEGELKRQQIEANKLAEIAAVKAEVEKAKQEVELAKLEARKAADKAKADNEYKLKLEAEKAKQERLKQEVILKQERERMQMKQEMLKQEMLKQERMKALQQEQERLKQQQEERLEQEKIAREAAILAEKAKSEQIKREEQQAQINKDIATAKVKNKTRKSTQQPVPQEDIDNLFDDCFQNGVLVNKRKLAGNIKNYYKRWKSATEKLTEPLSVKRRGQVETGLNNNKAKYELAVAKAKAYNIDIKEGEIKN